MSKYYKSFTLSILIITITLLIVYGLDRLVGNKDEEWNEMESVIEQFKKAGVEYPIWVMPTGAREEEQTATAGGVAERAFKRGYNVAARVHVYLFGNAIGT